MVNLAHDFAHMLGGINIKQKTKSKEMCFRKLACFDVL